MLASGSRPRLDSRDLLDQLAAKLLRADDNGAADRESVGSLTLANAIALLSGAGQVASLLRTGTLAGPAACQVHHTTPLHEAKADAPRSPN